MTATSEPERPLTTRAEWMAAVSLLITAGIDGGVNGAVARAVTDNGGFLGFGQIYLTVVLISLALTAGIALVYVPPLFGDPLPWHIPFLVFAAFAVSAGLPVINAGRRPATSALHGFLEHYGLAAAGAMLIGLIAGGLICLAADHLTRPTPNT